MVPVYFKHHRVAEHPWSHIRDNAGHYVIRRNSRGNVTRVSLRPRVNPLSLVSNRGTSFEQSLEHGRVWALRGTPGSEKAARDDAG